jgi:hypothetical protein
MKVLINILFPLLISEDSAINLRIDSWKKYDKLNYYSKSQKVKLNIDDLCMVIDPMDTTNSPSRFIVGVIKGKFDESILMQIHTEAYSPLLINVQYNQIYVVRRKRLEED